MPNRVWSTVLHAAYFSYYLIVTVPALIFLRRRQTAKLRHFVFTVMAAFVVCYLALRSPVPRVGEPSGEIALGAPSAIARERCGIAGPGRLEELVRLVGGEDRR